MVLLGRVRPTPYDGVTEPAIPADHGQPVRARAGGGWRPKLVAFRLGPTGNGPESLCSRKVCVGRTVGCPSVGPLERS